ncbi:MAG: ChaN family lipoprotein [Candidatus Sulfobium sp.]|jgi:aminopeptidase N
MVKFLSLFSVFFVFVMVLQSHAAASEQVDASLPVYKLGVSFDLKKNLLHGVAVIRLPEGVKTTVSVGGLRILSASFNGKAMKLPAAGFALSGAGVLEIRYEATFRAGQGEAANLENVGVVKGGVVDERGISLTGNWYPSINSLAYYDLAAIVPENFTAISEADDISFRETATGREYSFRFPYPVDGIDLVAAGYREAKGTVDGIDIYTYFFPEDANLSASYMEHAKNYFRMYDKLLVHYPYKRFSIVENILQTGYSMPTFTLLGQEVVRLPFIVDTSLGHEITHQWFGNYVYADFRTGNWLEAITTYLSDHLYAEQKGEGWKYRKKILTDYESYVTPDKEFPLREFTERTGFASMAIGYGKGAMVFHMLEDMVGKETFYKALRRLITQNEFRDASWVDIQKAFEQESGMSLAWFFSQWLDRKGIPSLRVKDPMVRVLKGNPAVTLQIIQKGQPYKLRLPIKIAAGHGETGKRLQIEKDKQYFDIAAGENPSKLIVDENYDVMRRLAGGELPPVVSRLLGAEKKIIVYEDKDKGKYADLIRIFQGEGFKSVEVKDLKDGDVQSSSLLVLGFDSPVLERLFADVGSPQPGFELVVRNNPLNLSQVVAYANAGSGEEAALAAPKIFHYGKYSVLRFEKGRNVEKETAGTDRGMLFSLKEPVAGVEPKNSLILDRIIDRIKDTPIIFVGERHTNYADHKVELDVIMSLHRQGRKLAVGMEMFQRPFQKWIDEYLAGTIDEKEFLKKSEYFKRWRYDYNLYREILEYAKAKGIRVVALNIDSAIIKKVAMGGLDALSAEQKKEIPVGMNMADEAYRKRLKEIFQDHPAGPDFENFYQSQILWDETMAHSVAAFLKEKPGYQMVVLAGAEHVMYDSGIPNRAYRLTGRKFVTLINGEFGEGVGGYVLFPKELKAPFTAKLGVMVDDKGGRAIIKDLVPGGAASRAGMEKGDIITSVDSWKVKDISDIKIGLLDVTPDQTVKVTALRKGFLFFGKRKMEFELSF